MINPFDMWLLLRKAEYSDVRARTIRRRCGHIEECYIFGNPIEKIATDLQESYCSRCTWPGVLFYELKPSEGADVPTDSDTGLRGVRRGDDEGFL